MTAPSTRKAPRLQGMPASWKEAQREEAFWEQHRHEFLESYPDQFVAVVRGKVIAASPELSELVGLLQSKGISPRRASIKFITANPRQTLL